jgi:hypothetical protein
MEFKNLIEANKHLIEDYIKLKEENKSLKDENKSLKEELCGKKRKIDESIEEPEKKKQKIENYVIGTSVEYIICKIYNETNNDFEKLFQKKHIDKDFVEENMTLFQKLKDYYQSLIYIGNVNNKFDFKINDSEEKYISVKSNFNGKKVCPQIIGQTTFKKYKSYFNIDEHFDISSLKNYIIENINIILKEYLKYTFHCDIIYYFKERKKNVLQIIKYDEMRLNNVEFEKGFISFSHIEKNKNWNESSTVYYKLNNKTISIGEFQIHNNRDNIKFRWHFDKIVQLCGFESIVL